MTKMESQTFDSLDERLQSVNVSGSNDFKLPNQEDLIVMFHSANKELKENKTWQMATKERQCFC